MDWVIFWAAIGATAGLVALVGVFFAIRSYYRANPKRRLEYSVACRRLVQHTEAAELEIRVGGVIVPNPHLVEFRLVSNSRADIPSDAFDGGKSIVVRTEAGAPFVLGEASMRGQIKVEGRSSESGWAWGEFVIPPQLIRRGAELSIDFIFDNEPEVVVEDFLIDIDVVNITERKKRRNELWLSVADAAVDSLLPVRVPSFRRSA